MRASRRHRHRRRVQLATRPVALLPVVLIGICGATFEERTVDGAPPDDPWMKGIGDLDRDGRLDLIVCGRNGPLVWYENPSWERRTLATATGPGGSATGLAIGDLDGNGSPDVVLANGIWFANPAPAGDPKQDPWARDEIDAAVGHDVALANLDGDADLDVVKRHQGAAGEAIRVFRQDPGGAWTERTIPAPAGEGLAVADLDADGDPDIAISGVWYENDGDPIGGAWTPHGYASDYGEPDVVVKVGQVGGSPRPDIVLSPAEAAGGRYRLSWFEAPADAEHPWPERIVLDDVEAVVHGLALGDFDRDGRTDIAYAEMHQGADPDVVRVLLQGADGSFAGGTLSSLGSHNLVAGDVDGDGRLDLFGANHDSGGAPDGGAVKLWRNRTAPEPDAPALAFASLATLAWLGGRPRASTARPQPGSRPRAPASSPSS